MKKGFTLIELLVVIVIIGVISASAVVSFSNIDNETSKKDLASKYREIQRSASVYIDLNDEWLDQFMSRKEIYIKLNELKNSNYIKQDLINPVTNEEISSSYSVKLFIDTKDDMEFVNSCIVNVINDSNITCIANSNGDSPCDYDRECK